jgi:branched-chain amino acid transport system substrate-binding protein
MTLSHRLFTDKRRLGAPRLGETMGNLTISRRRALIGGGALTVMAGSGARAAFSADKVYRLGALNPITGVASYSGTGMQKAIVIGAEEVNAAGGPAGMRFEVFAEDEQGSPEAALLATKKLVEVHGVRAILGTWSSAVTLALMPYTAAQNVILMHTSGASAIGERREKELVWRFTAASSDYGNAWAEGSAREGYKKAAVIGFNNPSALEALGAFRASWQKLGYPIAEWIITEPKRQSYRSELQRLVAADPDVIVMHAYPEDAVVVFREWLQFGARNKWMLPDWVLGPKMKEAVGSEVLEGLLAAEIVGERESPAYKRLAPKYTQLVGRGPEDNPYAVGSYDMPIVLGLALQSAGAEANNLAIVAAIRKVANPDGKIVSSFAEGKQLLEAGEKINYEGALGALDFNETGGARCTISVSRMRSGVLRPEYIFR